MAWQLRSRALWEETLDGQKRRLGKYLEEIDTTMPLDTFDEYLQQLDTNRAKIGLSRLFKPTVLDQLKEFTFAITTACQVGVTASFVWGCTQATLKTARSSVESVTVIADMITGITQQLPMFEDHRSLLVKAHELDEPLREMYCNYANFCIDAVLLLRSKRYKFLKRLALVNLRKSFEQTRSRMIKSASSFQTQVDIARTRLGVPAREQITGPNGEIVHRQTVVKGIPFHKNVRFQSRDDVLKDLYKKLHPNLDAHLNLPPTQTSCVIHGIGGVGKTQIALEYTYRYREDYSYIFWVRAENSVELLTYFANFARSLVPHLAVVDNLTNVTLVKDWMVQNADWLLIFDNADDDNVDLSLFWPPSLHGSIIITTQRRAVSHWAASDIHLDTFNEKEGGKLILEVIDQPGKEHSEETENMARDISIELGGLPLLLSHVACYIEGTKVPLNNILQSLRAQSEFQSIWAFDSTTSTNFQYGEPMSKVWRLALNSLKPEALQILQIMAMLSPDEIYEDIMFGDWEDAELGFLTEDRRFTFNKLRQSLTDRHLVGVTVEAGRTKLSIHRVLKRHLIQQLDGEGNDKLALVFKRAVAMVRRSFPKGDELQTPTSTTVAECEECLPHVLSLMSVFKDWAPKTAPTYEFATLLSDTGTNYMWERALPSDAIALLNMGERVCGYLTDIEEITLVYADLLAISGAVHEEKGLTGRAIALEKCGKALKLRDKRVRVLSERGDSNNKAAALQLANAKNDIGCVLLSFEDADRALPYFLESQKLKQKHATESELPWHYGELYKNLALVNLYQGNAVLAEEMARRSCELCCSGRAEKDASVQKARSLLGIVLMNIGKADEALRLHSSVYEVRKEIIGEENLHTKNSLYLIAELHRLKGEMERAESLFRLALSHTELCWTQEAVARAKYHLGLVIRALPVQMTSVREKEAEDLIRDARETRIKIAPTYSEVLAPAEELAAFDFMVGFEAGRWVAKK